MYAIVNASFTFCHGDVVASIEPVIQRSTVSSLVSLALL